MHHISATSFEESLLDTIHFFLKSPPHAAHLDDPSNIELIIRGDGFPVGKKHAIFLIFTLNFRVLGKTLGFNLSINLAEVDESNQVEVYAALKANLDEVDTISCDGVFNCNQANLFRQESTMGEMRLGCICFLAFSLTRKSGHASSVGGFVELSMILKQE